MHFHSGELLALTRLRWNRVKNNIEFRCSYYIDPTENDLNQHCINNDYRSHIEETITTFMPRFTDLEIIPLFIEFPAKGSITNIFILKMYPL